MAHVLHAPRATALHAFVEFVQDALSVFGAAARAAAAVEAHRQPKTADLAILGIAKDALPRA